MTKPTSYDNNSLPQPGNNDNQPGSLAQFLESQQELKRAKKLCGGANHWRELWVYFR